MSSARKPELVLPSWAIRLILIIVFVPAMAWVVVSRVWTELRGIPRYVWWDLCDNYEAIVDAWKTGVIPDEGDNW